MNTSSNDPPARPSGNFGEEHAYFVTVLRDLFAHPRSRRDRRKDPQRPMATDAGEVVAKSPQERRATAVAALLLAQVAERGGTNLDQGALLSVAEKAMETFPQGDRPAIFDEMVAVLDWLADNLRRKERDRARDPSPQSLGAANRSGRPPRGGRDDVEFDPTEAIAALETAIEASADVVLDYYSFHRKAWSERRVTPQLISGDFLTAHCHMREDDRRFRLTRIRKVTPWAGETPVVEAGPDQQEEIEGSETA
jgi:predicted DNA-binding transcriptional regulator YafY